MFFMRKKLFVLLCCLFAVTAVSAQYYLFNPKLKWSLGIEHSNPAVMVTQHDFLPDNIEISHWIRKHRYWQLGVIYVPLTDEITQSDPRLNIIGDTISKPIYFQSRIALYGGFAYKLYMRKKLYFTPSFHFYLEDYYFDRDNWAFAFGPTSAFEYFITNHFSLRLDLFNFNFAIASSGNFIVTLHRLAGVSLRYSWKRK